MIIFFIFVIIDQTNQQHINKCTWIDENQNLYDYSSLDKPNSWQIPDFQNGMGMFNMVYIFNFCNINLNCHNIPVAVFEGLEAMGTITDNCDIVGLENTKEISHIIDKPITYGISISFNDNSQCIETVNQNKPVQTNKSRTAIFNIICSKEKTDFKIIQGYGCTVIFEIYHPAGCPINSNFLTVYILYLFIIVFLCYIFYHKFQIIQFIPLIKSMIQNVSLICNSIISKLQNMIGYNQGYSLV